MPASGVWYSWGAVDMGCRNTYLVRGKGQGSTSKFSTILRFLSSQPGSFFHLLKLLSKLGVRQGDSQNHVSHHTPSLNLPSPWGLWGRSAL